MKDRYSVIFPFFIVLLIQLLVVASGFNDVVNGHLYGPDSYMRLNRVLDLWETGQWYDSTIERSNAPYGEVMHWTRPLDMILVAGAWMLSPLIGFKSALFLWGAMIGPILELAALAALIWAAKPIMAPQGLPYLGFLFIAQPGVVRDFIIGRPDHHGLLILLFLLFFGLTARILIYPFKYSRCYLAALIGAVSIWVSIESLIPVFLFIAVLVIAWIKAGGDFARKCAHLTLGLFAALALALVVEAPPQDLQVQVFDKISIVHVGIAAASALVCWVFYRVGELGPVTGILRYRLFTAGGGLLAMLAFIQIFSPEFFSGPMVHIDPLILTSYMDTIADGAPLVRSVEEAPLMMFFWLGLAFFAVPFLLCVIRRERDPGAWLYVLVGLAVFIALTLYQKRWAAYAETLLVIPSAQLLVVLMDWIKPRLRQVFHNAARALLVTAFSLGIPFFAVGVMTPDKQQEEPQKAWRCPLGEASAFLSQLKGTRTILTQMSFGSALVYSTPHRVVSSGFHRNPRGILDTLAFFSSTDGRRSRGIAQRRQVNLVLVCSGHPESKLYDPKSEQPTFYGRLISGRHPSWLRPVTLPMEDNSDFLLFEVIK
ncbi:MAG TPA: hypothetical protein ENI79_05795 [Rhodospirillales bacterium]|nr:hypothetical protein [Rhodospirillales bacterium]